MSTHLRITLGLFYPSTDVAGCPSCQFLQHFTYSSVSASACAGRQEEMQLPPFCTFKVACEDHSNRQSAQLFEHKMKVRLNSKAKRTPTQRCTEADRRLRSILRPPPPHYWIKFFPALSMQLRSSKQAFLNVSGSIHTLSLSHTYTGLSMT